MLVSGQTAMGAVPLSSLQPAAFSEPGFTVLPIKRNSKAVYSAVAFCTQLLCVSFIINLLQCLFRILFQIVNAFGDLYLHNKRPAPPSICRLTKNYPRDYDKCRIVRGNK